MNTCLGIAPGEFIEANEALVRSVLPEAALDAVLQVDETEPLSTVASQLETIVTGSLSGARLFASAWRALVHDRIETCIEGTIKKLYAAAEVTESVFGSLRLEAVNAIGQIPQVEIIPLRRTIKLVYQNVELTLPVRSHCEHVELRLMSVVRSCSVAAGWLPSLPVDGVVSGNDTNGKVAKVSKSVLTRPKQARDLFLRVLGIAKADSSSEKLLDRGLSQNHECCEY